MRTHRTTRRCDVPRLDSLRAGPRVVTAVSVAPDTTVTHNRDTPSTFQAWKRTKVNREEKGPKSGVDSKVGVDSGPRDCCSVVDSHTVV